MKNQRQASKKPVRNINVKEHAHQSQEARLVVVRPAGYPIRIAGEDSFGPASVLTDNPGLFQAYSRNMWGGIGVGKGDFLFDSMIFPDFAFEVIKVTPTTGEIGPNTRIELELLKEEKDEPLKVQAPVQFSEIIGQEEAKNKCTIIRKFLSDPELMTSPWAPRNIIFHGAPGTGKTMMARALASALNVKLLSIKAGELIGVYVGEGSKKVQNLFIQAKKSAPCIVFIDELDAIALKRNYQSVRGDVVEIVSSLLGELDGFYENRGIVTIAATNLVSEIDHAILSRFEEIIEFKLPTQEERRQILAHKSSTSPIPFEADWNRLAAETKSWSGRDLVDKLLKTAIHQAILGDKKKIANDDLLKIIKSNTSEQSQKHYV